MSKHRDMSRTDLMEACTKGQIVNTMAPMLSDSVHIGDKIINVASLFIDTRLVRGRHVSNYRLSWRRSGMECEELKLGDAVSFELAVHMYQELLGLLSLSSIEDYSKERIVTYLLNLDI